MSDNNVFEDLKALKEYKNYIPGEFSVPFYFFSEEYEESQKRILKSLIEKEEKMKFTKKLMKKIRCKLCVRRSYCHYKQPDIIIFNIRGRCPGYLRGKKQKL